MKDQLSIHAALLSVYEKEGLEPLLKQLTEHNVQLISTGGTASFIRKQDIPVIRVEDRTGFPSILGGRVKTLHPTIFGGILSRRDEERDRKELQKHHIDLIDLVVVDLYPFEETLQEEAQHEELIEKIDIGGIALIRAAAKNYDRVVVIPSRMHYPILQKILESGGKTTLELRKQLAAEAFRITSQYDQLIAGYLSDGSGQAQQGEQQASSPFGNMEQALPLKYGENPHQAGIFYGDFSEVAEKLSGKDLSYNNLLDVDAAVGIIQEFPREEGITFTVIKHTNPCGVATRQTASEAYEAALAGDPQSAFGGIIATNETVNLQTAKLLHELFFEVLIAPGFDEDAQELLTKKKKRILLRLKDFEQPQSRFRSVLNGVLMQGSDTETEGTADLQMVTEKKPSEEQVQDLLFANKVVKHAKSNAITLVKDRQLIGIGAGQTSRVDALEQAIAKAEHFGFETKGAVLASDAFFPFADSVKAAHKAGVAAVIQPGGSIRDQESIDYCNEAGMAMVFTSTRHFKH